uniref:Uncharacterized protein n=1 Tax=Mucochytrium quahogii TaxID=96639 RepID=A0A7S2WS21_9STRA|mmetsp:Transcript_37089/g.60446  ORF Transcript_37089/g.60446 Transcript_37089/m.60446 type:complete len:417 (+) Transcript_37089:516-1766(+)|eukprot:CAMPEP_0203751102 /NCGR_PEP_ID=MMETSP0098-20131031/5231_1 /ASSEMBLY_ACC=CAM_ASM_000208 /TAXON_ID=96639 /ORGANISM=" , Strain NY0313808BC1" /LENGTH=416 /DNA_ID=CAMNT_0050640675 /DNA_START=77 /DNA_END=1327 /DNA_ORIENTATION=-
MYKTSGSTKVEIWSSRQVPIQNVQHEFNPAFKNIPAIVQVHSGRESNAATDAAELTATNAQLRRDLKGRELEEFQHVTKIRLARWNAENSVTAQGQGQQPDRATREMAHSFGSESYARHSVEGKENHRRNYAFSESAYSEMGSFDKSLQLSRHESKQARSNLLKFTQGRRSFRVVSDALPPSPSRYSVRSHGVPRTARGQAKAKKFDIEAMLDVCGDPDTSFQDLETYQTKERIAQHQANVRKKEMAFARLLVRRRRALREHKKNAQHEKDSLCSAHRGSVPSPERDLEQKAEEERRQKSQEESEQRRAKATQKRREKDESLRYISALQHRLEEMTRSKSGVRFPVLCGCSRTTTHIVRGSSSALFSFEPDTSDSNLAVVPSAPWENCANNCIFYKNPHAYAKALADLFRSLQLPL